MARHENLLTFKRVSALIKIDAAQPLVSPPFQYRPQFTFTCHFLLGHGHDAADDACELSQLYSVRPLLTLPDNYGRGPDRNAIFDVYTLTKLETNQTAL